MWPWKTRSPYLREGRLADVLAALQVMGSAKRPEAKVSTLAQQLDGNSNEAAVARWTLVFQEHREFFLVYQRDQDPALKAALRWRYAYKRFDSESNKEYSEAEFAALDKSNVEHRSVLDRLTTKPLMAEQIQTLLNTAIGLRTTALEEDKARVWWVALVAAGLSFAGAIANVIATFQKP